MLKKKLLEFSAPRCEILEELVDEHTRERVMRVAVKWQQAEVINGNGRRYPRHVLQREIERLMPMAEQGAVYGASYHPKQDAEVDDVSHIWESARMEEDGSCVGVLKVLPTERGRNAQAIIKYGGHIGLSSRGYGTMTRKSETVDGKEISFDEINDDFQLKSFGDFVLTPSVPDAGVRRMLESRMDDEPDDSKPEGKEKPVMKNLEALRSEYAELLKPLDEEIAALKAERDELTTKLADAEQKVAELEQAKTTLVDGVRSAVAALAEMDGVVPEEKEPAPEPVKEEPTPEAEPEPTPEAEPVAEPEAEPEPTPEAEPEPTPEPEPEPDNEPTDEAAKKIAALEAEVQKLKEEKETAVNEQSILLALKEALVDETPEYRKLIENKLVKEGHPTMDKVEEVAKAVEIAKEAIATEIAELKKSKIRKTGLDSKGHISDPEGDADKLTEAQRKSRWQEARKAGYKGTLEQYSTDVLKQ